MAAAHLDIPVSRASGSSAVPLHPLGRTGTTHLHMFGANPVGTRTTSRWADELDRYLHRHNPDEVLVTSAFGHFITLLEDQMDGPSGLGPLDPTKVRHRGRASRFLHTFRRLNRFLNRPTRVLAGSCSPAVPMGRLAADPGVHAASSWRQDRKAQRNSQKPVMGSTVTCMIILISLGGSKHGA